MCKEGEASYAHEKHTRLGACHTHLLLRKTPSSMGHVHYLLQSIHELVQKEQAEARLKALAHDSVTSSPSSKLSKSARAYAKTYKTGPPLVPQIIVDRIINYISKINVRKKPEFVQMACKYWSLKREARRGAPLLKRLHLEPWTASNAGKLLSEEEKTLKLEVRDVSRPSLHD